MGTFQIKMLESRTAGGKMAHVLTEVASGCSCLFPWLVLNAIKRDAAASLRRRRLNSVHVKAAAAAASEAMQHKLLPSSREVVNKSRRHA